MLIHLWQNFDTFVNILIFSAKMNQHSSLLIHSGWMICGQKTLFSFVFLSHRWQRWLVTCYLINHPPTSSFLPIYLPTYLKPSRKRWSVCREPITKRNFPWAGQTLFRIILHPCGWYFAKMNFKPKCNPGCPLKFFFDTALYMWYANLRLICK